MCSVEDSLILVILGVLIAIFTMLFWKIIPKSEPKKRCPECDSTNVWRFIKRAWGEAKEYGYKCNDCGNAW